MYVNNTKNLVLQEALVSYYEEFADYVKYNNYLAKSITDIMWYSLSRIRKNYKIITRTTCELNSARMRRNFYSINYYVSNTYSNICSFSRASYYNNY